MKQRLLDKIDRPADLKSLSVEQLETLSGEIRQTLIETISGLGGHLASSLGAVELCLAMHYVFNAPKDHLVWDMGYQAFTNKLITGRRDRFHTLKQYQGLSGFNHKDESPYDLFITGHGGTCISTALGLAMARDLQKKNNHVLAILGDASLGEGMALEALNHAGHVKSNLIVVLNDNRMSIAKPIGGLSKYLTQVINNPTYRNVKEDVEQLMKKLPAGSKVLKLGHRVEESLKGVLTQGRLFRDFGFRYIGPVDGHNLQELISTFKNAKQLKGPMLLHVSTTKGKGYRPAEEDPERFHKTEAFDIPTGKAKVKARTKTVSFSDAFAEEMVELGQSNDKVVTITAAMPEGTGVASFAKKFPDRCIDVGMAEQHAVGLAAGLREGGLIPVVAIYSTFMQRAFDQIMHEMCLQRLPVILALDRASLVGEDGPTHHGIFDIGYLRILPNMTVLTPKDPGELRDMLRFAVQHDGPIALRYARGGIGVNSLGKSEPIQYGKSETLREGEDVALIAAGNMVYAAMQVADSLAKQGIEATVVNARFIKPVDAEMVKRVANNTGRIVTIEEGQIQGGFGSAVSETLDQLRLSTVPQLRIGLPDEFIEHGGRDDLLSQCNLLPNQITATVRQWIAGEPAVAQKVLTQSAA